MMSLNRLNELESTISQELCRLLFGLHDVEQESWFSPYGGPNQLQSEVSECRNLVQSILRDLNFGSKESGAKKYSEFITRGCNNYPASLNFIDLCAEEGGDSDDPTKRQKTDSV